MRILRIGIRNLNSLAGNHSIDFREEPLVSAGLYAIVGPTGAGKSTILDAILLALYGKTERDRTGQDVMTHGEGECFAEVEYETQDGRFLNRWERRRARNKASGNLQTPQMSISRWEESAGQFVIVEADRLSSVKERTERTIGIGYENFTRAVMLTQGQFARFLTSPVEKKSGVLERITGTGIYRRISSAAYERCKLARESFERLKANRETLAPLSAEDRRQLEEGNAGLTEQARRLRPRKKELDALEKQYAESKRLDRETQAETQHIATAEASLAQLKKTAATFDARGEEADRQLADFNKTLPEKRKIVARAAALETQLAELAAAAKLEDATLAATRRDHAALERRLAELDRETQPLQARLGTTDAAALDDRLAAVSTKKDQQKQEVEALQAALERSKITAELTTLDAQLKTARTAEETARKTLETTHELVDHRRKMRETVLRDLGLEPLKNELVSGDPCPLCGSVHHPALEQWEPLTDANLKLAEEDLAAAAQRLATDEAALAAAARELATLDARREAKATALKALPAAAINGDLTTLEKELTAVRKTLAATEKQLGELSAQRTAATQLLRLATETSEKNKQRKTLDAQLAKLTESTTARSAKARELAAAKHELIRDKTSAECRDMLDRRQQKFTTAVESVRREREGNARQLTETETRIAAHRQRVGDLKAAVSSVQKSLAAAPPLEHITTEATELEARLSALDQRIGGLQKELEQDDERRLASSLLTTELEKSRTEFERWARLNDLIGQQNGDKFSRFAQTLTLRRLVVAGNHHLHRINPRYRIEHLAATDVSKETLELEIVDTYQGDNRRPIATLSGGETFLVSLALALGLSDLARGRADVKSLFIDEGFGTLDDRVLDQAITALELLEGQGKSIGLISHVRELRERIGTQIRLVQRGNGLSEIEVVR